MKNRFFDGLSPARSAGLFFVRTAAISDTGGAMGAVATQRRKSRRAGKQDKLAEMSEGLPGLCR